MNKRYGGKPEVTNPFVPEEGMDDEAFTKSYSWGTVGRVGRTEEELRRARRDWLAGVGPDPRVLEVRKRNENCNEEPQFGRAPGGRHNSRLLPIPGLEVRKRK